MKKRKPKNIDPIDIDIQTCLKEMEKMEKSMEQIILNWIQIDARVRKTMMDQRAILSEKEAVTKFFQGSPLKEKVISHK